MFTYATYEYDAIPEEYTFTMYDYDLEFIAENDTIAYLKYTSEKLKALLSFLDKKEAKQ